MPAVHRRSQVALHLAFAKWVVEQKKPFTVHDIEVQFQLVYAVAMKYADAALDVGLVRLIPDPKHPSRKLFEPI